MIKKHANISIERSSQAYFILWPLDVTHDAKNGGKFQISFKNNPNAKFRHFLGKTLQLIKITIDTK